MLGVDAVRVVLGGRAVLDNASLAVAQGEVVAITGPSGSGKSTLLRAVAGLVPLQGGRIVLNGVDLADVPTHRRGIGFMFQDFALFPHRDVGGNVEFGLRMARWDRARMAARVAELLELVGLPSTERRAVATLSGGEQQRVALARALAPEPRLLLLDEPLGALDRELHDRLTREVREVLTKVGITAVVVTHDPQEAAVLGDRTVDIRTLSPGSTPGDQR